MDDFSSLKRIFRNLDSVIGNTDAIMKRVDGLLNPDLCKKEKDLEVRLKRLEDQVKPRKPTVWLHSTYDRFLTWMRHE